MEISERLKQARTVSGMTQEQVAENIMVSRVTLSHWENGKTLPDIASLISLSDLYQISLDELLKGDPKMTEKVKKDAKDLKSNKRLILITAIFCIVVMAVYIATGCHLRQGASPIMLIIIVGGEFKDFSQAATPWLLMGIGIAAVITYSDQKEETHKKD